MVIDGMQASMLRGLAEYLLNPLFWVFFILLCVIIYLLWPGRNRIEKRAGVVLLLLWVGFYIVSTPWLPNWMIARFENQSVRVRQVDPQVHWVVVLGGGVTENSEIFASEALTGSSLKRVLEGVRLYRELPQARLILSGGGTLLPQHATAARYGEFTDWLNIPKAHRVLEVNPVNTAEEARLIKPLVGDAPFYLVTSAIHMPRAKALFEKQGLHPIAAPSNYMTVKGRPYPFWQRCLPKSGNLARFRAVWHEYLGQLSGKVKGEI